MNGSKSGMGANPLDTISLTLQIDQGTNGIDRNSSNPLSRALARLLLDGKPFLQISYCLFGYEDSVFSETPGLRWLGVLVLSADERIIFFPGFSISPTWIRAFRGNLSSVHRDFDLDHISLERGLRQWHFTSPGSRDHYAGGYTTPLDSGQFMWFGLSVAEDTLLRELNKQTAIIAQMPSSDSDRRIRNFTETNDQAAYHVILLPKEAKRYSEKGFLHFTFVAGPKGMPPYRGANLGLPIGSPFLTEPLPEGLLQLPIRTHSVSLGPKIDIQITSMWLPGSLTIPVTFTTQSRR